MTKVWVLECSETSHGWGEDAFMIESVFSTKEGAQTAGDNYKRGIMHGQCMISEHEVKGPKLADGHAGDEHE